MKFGMNQVQVPPFGLKLRQDEATTSRNPPEWFFPPKTPPKNPKIRKNGENSLSPIFPILGCCAVGSTSGAVYTGLGRRVRFGERLAELWASRLKSICQ